MLPTFCHLLAVPSILYFCFFLLQKHILKWWRHANFRNVLILWLEIVSPQLFCILMIDLLGQNLEADYIYLFGEVLQFLRIALPIDAMSKNYHWNSALQWKLKDGINLNHRHWPSAMQSFSEPIFNIESDWLRLHLDPQSLRSCWCCICSA